MRKSTRTKKRARVRHTAMKTASGTSRQDGTPAHSSTASFVLLPVEIHIETGEYLSDKDLINVILAWSSRAPEVSAYIRELKVRDDRSPPNSPDRLKTALRWAYASVPPAHLRQIMIMLPAAALEPPTRPGALIPLPGGVTELFTHLRSWSMSVEDQSKIASKIVFGGCGAMCIAASEGNLPAITVLLERWNWCDPNAALPLKWACIHARVEAVRMFLSDMRERLTQQQRGLLLLKPTETDTYTAIDCALIAMHTPCSTASGRHILDLVIAEVSCFPGTLCEAKLGAMYLLIELAKESLQWDDDSSVATLNAMLDALALPLQNYHAGEIFHTLKSCSSTGARMRLLGYARRCMAADPPSPLIAADWVKSGMDQEVLDMIDEFVPGGLEAVQYQVENPPVELCY
ncbi:hypothetical protein FN846DRAFT_949704 [Sphaerosporella brunnea]|uniref:Uncharacterized protein n=1 Tax=Sphaerosporella brunnea TaxID=1250544 RepID=A0A5J5EX19_9PEZI|nr:hypothetical protein FN846DRAFT_949704 [Sphaerosporella brunnea]